MKIIRRLLNLIPMIAITTLSGCTLKDLWGGKDPSELTRDEIVILLGNVVNWLAVGAGTVAFIFLIIGGYAYITSLGNEEKAEQGKKTLIYAIIGFILILGAYAIVKFLMKLMLKEPGRIFL